MTHSWYKIAKSKAHYVGNCVTGFDNNTGNCTIGIFQDVTEFAQREEAARDIIDQLNINPQTFLQLVDMPKTLLKKDMEFYQLPQETSSMTYPDQILVAYDINSGVHHFFA